MTVGGFSPTTRTATRNRPDGNTKPMRTQISLPRPKPIGLQVRDALLNLIVRDGLKAGDRIPSEARLCDLFGVSRPTLREALRLLEQDGLVRTEHGSGRFLTGSASLRVIRPITIFESTTTMLAELGIRAETRVLSLTGGTGADDKQAAAALKCKANAPLVFIERVRSAEGKPLVYSQEIVPQQFLPERLDEAVFAGSLTAILAARHYQPRMSSATVSAVFLPDVAAATLGLTHPAPWLLITETCLTETGTPVIFARDYHAGAAMTFNLSRR